MAKNYGFFGFGKQRTQRDPRDRFLYEPNVTNFIVVVAIGIALVSIISGIVGIWYAQAAAINQQVGMGLLVLIIITAIYVPFILVRRQFMNFTAKEYLFVILAIGVLIFLLVITPKLFNLPELFSTARLELVQSTQSILGFP